MADAVAKRNASRILIESDGIGTTTRITDANGRNVDLCFSRVEWSLDAREMMSRAKVFVCLAPARVACTPDWLLGDSLGRTILLPDGLTVAQAEAIGKAFEETVGIMADEVLRSRRIAAEREAAPASATVDVRIADMPQFKAFVADLEAIAERGDAEAASLIATALSRFAPADEQGDAC